MSTTVRIALCPLHCLTYTIYLRYIIHPLNILYLVFLLAKNVNQLVIHLIRYQREYVAITPVCLAAYGASAPTAAVMKTCRTQQDARVWSTTRFLIVFVHLARPNKLFAER